MKQILKISMISLLIIFCYSSMLNAQALITNQDPPVPAGPEQSAVLELRSDNLGFMIPHIQLTLDGDGYAIAPTISDPADGLVIYFEGSDDVPGGLWYFDGNEFNRWVIYTQPGSAFSNSVDNYAEIYEDQLESTVGPTSYTLSNSDWTGWASATEGRVSEAFFMAYTAAVPDGPGSAGDYLEILEDAPDAVYSVTASMIVESVSSGIPFIAQIYIIRAGTTTAVGVDGAFVKHYFQTGDEYATLSASALVDLFEGDKVGIRMKTDNANETAATVGVNLRLAKIADIQ